MTLKEKFEPYVIRYTQDDVVGYLSEETPILEYQEQCEKIADEFAIGFAEFSRNYNYHLMHKVWIRYDKMANEKFTTKQLLEIYKKEKGL